MAETKAILVNGGLVTSKDPSMLKEGELVEATDAMYKPNDPALWKVKGRSAFNSTAESAIIGCRFLQFDGADDLFIASSSTNFRKATAGPTGTFSDLVTGLTSGATSLDSVHYNNEHVLMDGVNRNRVVASDGTATLHGMLTNTTAPTMSRDAGAGTGFVLSSGNTITYWVEERVKSGSTVLRRNAASSATVVTLTGDGSTDKPVVTRPTALNSDATHWALYGTATNSSFPTGAEIAEVEIATATIEDTRTGTDPEIPAGEVYEVLSVSLAGITQNVPRNGPPPIATTGDIMEDSLVLNDVSDHSRVLYSTPDEIHQFPAFNFIRFETKQADEVVLIRTLGQIGIVGLSNSMWRVETLPRPEDASFQIERVKALIHEEHGVTGPMAATLFSFGQGPKLAYVSTSGVMVTDGYSWDVLSDDLDWEASVSMGSLSRAVLVNYPQMYQLRLYLAEGIAYYFHYHPSHVKASEFGLRAKVTGPIHVAATSAFVASLSGSRVVFTGNSDGKLYQEDIGPLDRSGAGGIAFSCKTGRQYLNNVSGDAKVLRWWVHHRAAPNQSATATMTMHSSEEGDDTESESISLTRNEATGVYRAGQGEGFQFGVSNSDELGQIAINSLFAEVDGLGGTQ